MSTMHTFYLSPEDWRTPFILKGQEANHLAKVLRIKPGATVRLFDGCGRHGMFRVDSVTKGTVTLSLVNESFEQPPVVRCTLAAGFSKALRRGWFLEKAVELEAAALWFWQGDYSQASLPEQEKETWKNSLIAGGKQCENAWLPELSMLHGGIEALAAKVPSFDRAFLLYEGDTEGRLLQKTDLETPGSLLLIVGPEGGFSPREVDILLQAGAQAVSLGSRILRWETAAVLTLGMAWWARQGLSDTGHDAQGTS